MKWTALFVRAFLITTAFDFAVISMLLFFFGDLVIENLLLGWAGILIVRFALWLRTTGLRTIEYFIGKASAIDALTRLMRVNEVSRDYQDAWDFETLVQEVQSDPKASVKANRILFEMLGFRQGISPLLGILYAFKMDRAVAKYLA